VVFLTLDDGTGPVDATFFEDAQGPYAATVFGSWLLVVRGEVRRTGHRGISLRATGAWPLTDLHARWEREGIDAVRAHLAVVPAYEEVTSHRVLTHSSGFQMSPYADVKPPGESLSSGGLGRSLVPRSTPSPAAKGVARKLWHRSPGSPG
jgi:error-prone DNA polymerase